jgi:HPt (histidine-containing phosphotransfer) domain-containing protein
VQLEQFHDRVAAVRRRFASTLDGKIKDTFGELATLGGEGGAAAAAVAGCYRRIHGISGVAAAVGFPATGRAAKTVEDSLVPAFRAGRGLNPGEAAQLQRTLEELSIVATAELRAAGSANA